MYREDVCNTKLTPEKAKICWGQKGKTLGFGGGWEGDDEPVWGGVVNLETSWDKCAGRPLGGDPGKRAEERGGNSLGKGGERYG